ncbi:MAG TPA: DUF1629 domain-containing protein [Bacillota bacterium]
MEYFILNQDEQVTEAVKPLGISGLVKDYGLTTESWESLNDLPEQFYLDEDGGDEYVDFIAAPVPLVSSRLKELFQKFDARIFFKPVVLADPKAMRQELYWLINPSSCDCIAAQSEFNKDGTVKHLVIDQHKAEGRWIFKVAGIMEHWIIVNLGVAEAVLRREFSGVRFIRVDSI